MIRPDGTPEFSSASWIRRSPKIRPAPNRLGAAGSGFHRHLRSGESVKPPCMGKVLKY
jgi:hypothetical protein